MMKLFKSVPILFLLLSTLTTVSFADAGPVHCGLTSANLSPDSYFFISSEEIGTLVTLGDENYRIVSSNPGMFDDIYVQYVTLQSLQYPEASPTELACF
jgi:hypothetical protein